MDSLHPINHREAQSFARSVRDNPDNQIIRRVYSDWLLDNGFPEHSEAVIADMDDPFEREEDTEDHEHFNNLRDFTDSHERALLLNQAGIDPVRGYAAEEVYSDEAAVGRHAEKVRRLHLKHGTTTKMIDKLIDLSNDGYEREVGGMYAGFSPFNQEKNGEYAHDLDTGHILFNSSHAGLNLYKLYAL